MADRKPRRKPWPYAASEARNQAAEAMQRADQKLDGSLLMPIIEMKQMTREESALRAAKTLADLNAVKAEIQQALRWLESVEAPTRP